MGAGTRVECDACQAAWEMEGLRFVVASDGTMVLCLEPTPLYAEEQVFQPGVSLLERWRRSVAFSSSLCVRCWNVGYYRWTISQVEAITKEHVSWGEVNIGELHLWPHVPPGGVRHCAPFQCVSCRRTGPLLLWPGWMLDLLLVPLSLLCHANNGLAPLLPCPLCRRRALHLTPWIS